TLKGWRPGPLDDGGAVVAAHIQPHRCVVGCARSLTHLQVRSLVCSPPPCAAAACAPLQADTNHSAALSAARARSRTSRCARSCARLRLALRPPVRRSRLIPTTSPRCRLRIVREDLPLPSPREPAR